MDMAESEDEEDLVEDVYVYITDKQRYPHGASANRKRVIRNKAKKFVVRDGELYYKKVKRGRGSPKQAMEVKYIRNSNEKLRILKACHMDATAGHMGVKRTLARITERFMWPGVVKDVEQMVRTCDTCQRGNRKMTIITPELHPVPVKSPWYHIGIDFIGPVTTSTTGSEYILTISDYLTKWVEAAALPTKCASATAGALFKVFMRMGIPRVLTSDQGSEFRNKLNEELASLLGIQHRLTTAYHPQANGLDERFNQTLQTMLTKFVGSKKESWDEFLDTSVFAYNTSRHESTMFTPFELMFGRRAHLPVDVDSNKCTPEELLEKWHQMGPFTPVDVEQLTARRQQLVEEAKSKIKAAQEKQKHYYDLKHAKPCVYEVGAKVLLKDFTRKKRKGGKLDVKWIGPFQITKSLGKGVYMLMSIENPAIKAKRVTGAHLKPYNTPLASPDQSSPQSLESFSDPHTSQTSDSLLDCSFLDSEQPSSLEPCNQSFIHNGPSSSSSSWDHDWSTQSHPEATVFSPSQPTPRVPRQPVLSCPAQPKPGRLKSVPASSLAHARSCQSQPSGFELIPTCSPECSFFSGSKEVPVDGLGFNTSTPEKRGGFFPEFFPANVNELSPIARVQPTQSKSEESSNLDISDESIPPLPPPLPSLDSLVRLNHLKNQSVSKHPSEDSLLAQALKKRSRKHQFDNASLVQPLKKRPRKQQFQDSPVTQPLKKRPRKEQFEDSPLTQPLKKRSRKEQFEDSLPLTQPLKKRSRKEQFEDSLPLTQPLKKRPRKQQFEAPLPLQPSKKSLDPPMSRHPPILQPWKPPHKKPAKNRPLPQPSKTPCKQLGGNLPRPQPSQTPYETQSKVPHRPLKESPQLQHSPSSPLPLQPSKKSLNPPMSRHLPILQPLNLPTRNQPRTDPSHSQRRLPANSWVRTHSTYGHHRLPTNHSPRSHIVHRRRSLPSCSTALASLNQVIPQQNQSMCPQYRSNPPSTGLKA